MELTETKQQFIELRAKGLSFDKIAKEMSKSKQTLIDWSRDLSGEIANLKAIQLEEMYQTYYLLKENRLQTLGTQLNKIKAEVDKRDFTDIPTDKLLDLLLKYNSKVAEELVEPEYKSKEEIETAQRQAALSNW